jgi:hypothetical protein
MNKKKRLVYPGKATLAKKKKKKKILSNLDDPPKIDDNDDGDDDKNNKNNNQDDDAKELMIRKSTRTSVIVRQAEREAIREALKATYKVISNIFFCDSLGFLFNSSCYISFSIIYLFELVYLCSSSGIYTCEIICESLCK